MHPLSFSKGLLEQRYPRGAGFREAFSWNNCSSQRAHQIFLGKPWFPLSHDANKSVLALESTLLRIIRRCEGMPIKLDKRAKWPWIGRKDIVSGPTVTCGRFLCVKTAGGMPPWGGPPVLTKFNCLPGGSKTYDPRCLKMTPIAALWGPGLLAVLPVDPPAAPVDPPAAPVGFRRGPGGRRRRRKTCNPQLLPR